MSFIASIRWVALLIWPALRKREIWNWRCRWRSLNEDPSSRMPGFYPRFSLFATGLQSRIYFEEYSLVIFVTAPILSAPLVKICRAVYLLSPKLFRMAIRQPPRWRLQPSRESIWVSNFEISVRIAKQMLKNKISKYFLWKISWKRPSNQARYSIAANLFK